MLSVKQIMFSSAGWYYDFLDGSVMNTIKFDITTYLNII